ncbi:MAG: NAD(P)-dependent oxidoreductase [Oxalicibacterium faecigallinarum]|uniref:NAD(P)-dependent oxidoreductase n=1 Tax=Oxalicibacterium faecigallinarum TaxID=573741 RepID=UPI002808F843|nr:NAD(P)-dependent oxidoreductase [Oxalicibacterium faecigallinarum]MDQ7970531.1 NAD(P)-dependent oxidoreductase [Oxalicibacterium faecigallinarum]
MTQSAVPQAKPTIAFLGIGLMGKPMATRLLQAGYAVTVWNRTRAKSEELLASGAQVADQAAEAVRQADIVITMLEAGPIVAQVVNAALTGLRAGTLLIDMSSTRQSEAQDMHALLAASGVRFIDAPVSGGVVGAQAGTLAIMAGGSADDFADAEAVLRVMGRPTLVGPAGCGQIAKLCNQLIVGGTLNIVAEALLLAQAGGADPAAVRTAIRGGFAESRILEVHGQRMLERNFMPGGQVMSQHKDLENVLIAAGNAGLRLPVTELVTRHYQSLMPVAPRADQCAVLLALEKENEGLRLGTAPDQLPAQG